MISLLIFYDCHLMSSRDWTGRVEDILDDHPILGSIVKLVGLVGQINAGRERARLAGRAAHAQRCARLVHTLIHADYLNAHRLAFLQRSVHKHIGVLSWTRRFAASGAITQEVA